MRRLDDPTLDIQIGHDEYMGVTPRREIERLHDEASRSRRFPGLAVLYADSVIGRAVRKIKFTGAGVSSVTVAGDTVTVTVSGGGGAGTGDVTGPASSSNGEVALFSGTTGKVIKRSSTISGIAKLASGVLSAATAGVDYLIPGGVTSADVTDFTEAAQDAVAAMANSSASITATYVDATPTLTFDVDSRLASPVDLGSTPVYAGKFTITDASFTTSTRVMVWRARYSGQDADELEMDAIVCQAPTPGAGSCDVYWVANPGPVSGNQAFRYLIMAA